MRALALLCCFVPSIAGAIAPKVHTVIGKYGVRFHHFEYQLSAQNTILPGDLRSQRERLDETTENFQYGQFEVFIPAKFLDLGMGCKSNYIVRMPMTLNRKEAAPIKEKQLMYYKIKKAVKSRSGAVHAVIEISYQTGCNLFFRSASDGRYLNYVGSLKK